MIKTFTHFLHKLCLLISLILIPNTLYSQKQNLIFDHYIDEKGFTQNSVMKVIQDKDGFIWVGTPNGLYKYDGLNFTVFRHEANTPNSLVSNSVFELELDINGNILIGTSQGLSRYNIETETFETYPKILKNKRISAIYPDTNGDLWVGTLYSGLYFFKKSDLLGENPIHYEHKPNKKSSIDSDKIHSIVKDRGGNLWVGTVRGLNKMSAQTNQDSFIHFDTINESIKLVFLDKKGTLWASLVGLSLIEINSPENFNKETQNNFKKYSFNIKKPDRDEYGGIITMFEGSNDYLWLGIHGYGLYLFNTKNGEYTSYVPDIENSASISSTNVESILIDNTNVLWVGTEEGGLNKCDLEHKDILYLNQSQFTKQSLSNPSINAITKASSNSYWIGTQNGLNRLTFKNNQYNKNDISYEHFFTDEGLTHSTPLIKQPVWSILKDNDNEFWLGTSDGIAFMKTDSSTQKVTINKTDLNILEVSASLKDRNGNLWFGSFLKGLVKWKKKKKNGKFDFSNAKYYLPKNNTKYSISGKEISCIFEDSKGNIWIGTLRGGLNLFIPAKKGRKDQFISYQHEENNPNSISNNSIFSIHEDKEGNLWIGTFGGGLNKMIFSETDNSDPIFKNYTEKDGLANNAIYGILSDKKNNLWISTDNGISQFNPKTENFQNLNRGDGLQSNNFRINAHFKNDDGYLFFGGLRGLNIFNPDNLKENTTPPKVKLTGLKIKNERINAGEKYNGRTILEKSISNLKKTLSLNHNENTLTFEFAALHFAAPEKNKFKYKLVGFDKNWQNSKKLPFAYYTNLSPGDYKFLVKAANNDGIWNETPAEVKFKIRPPFWLTWWAFTFYGICLLGLNYAITLYFRLKEKERLALKVQKEIAEVNKLKLQFFTNISHEFKTPITLILTPIEEALNALKNNPKATTQLNTIKRNANYLLRLVNQLMEFRKIEVGETKLAASKSNIINFVREITFSFSALAKSKNIELTFESQLYNFDVWFDWDKLEKILNNLIFNAIKFSDSQGRVVVKINKSFENSFITTENGTKKHKYIKIEIEDNGPGISPEQLPYVFQRFYQVNQQNKTASSGSGIGLAITKDLVDLHYGTIEVTSTKGKGSIFVIKLPVGKSHLLPEEINENKTPIIISEDQLEKEDSILNEDHNINTPTNNKKTVLIVDDNKDIRELVKSNIEKKYNVLEAENGKAALNLALKNIPELIISDVLMPEMDGIEFCQQIKNNIRTSHIPIILLTALNAVEHRIKGLESGAEAYIPKPFNMQLLSVRVDKLIESRENIIKQLKTEEKLTPSKVAFNSIDREFLEKIMEFMEANMGNESYWLDELANDMNTSRSTFFRKLKKLTGQPPNDFMRMIRLKRATQLLDQNQYTIAEISYKVGFNDPGYFSKCFRKAFGQPPSQYKNNKHKSN
ncbi:two-component regulator propeller domain-containing protein [Postechiella marina]|uniref:histidine kinase n=1 Tax=Postechiella marina TaxID=943941 RepID=A0ABP8CAW7_9FLAO